jgi:hypothetical protein
MTTTIDEVRAALWTTLDASLADGDLAEARRDDAADAVIPFGTVTMHVAVLGGPAGHPVLEASTEVWADAPRSAELSRFAAEVGYLFGRLQLVPTGEGRCRVVLFHTMLGEGLAEAQLLPILATVADTAQELARHLPARFSASRAD